MSKKTIQEIRDDLIGDLEKIRKGEMPPNKAKAISGHVNQIVNTVKVELEYVKLKAEAQVSPPTELFLDKSKTSATDIKKEKQAKEKKSPGQQIRCNKKIVKSGQRQTGNKRNA